MANLYFEEVEVGASRQVLLRNQKRETVLECFATVLIARRPAP